MLLLLSGPGDAAGRLAELPERIPSTDVGGVPRSGAVNRRRLGAAATVAVAAWIVLGGLLTLCGEGIEHSPAVLSLDTSITTFVAAHRTPALNEFMKALTFTGSWVAAMVLATVVLILSLTHRVPFRAVAAVLLAWLGEILAVTLSKWLVQRPRPPESVRLVVTHGWSFPSGHTANTVVVFATTAGLVVILFHRKYVSVLTWALCTAVTAVVGFSRIELGAHWTTDVAASWAWTACWLLTLFVILRRPLWSSRGLLSTDKPALTERANDPD